MLLHTIGKFAVVLLTFWLLPIVFGTNDTHAVEATVGVVGETAVAPTGVATTDLWAPTVRMILGLVGVLAVLGILALLAQRLRRGNVFKSGLIEIVSGVSLGGREKVVLLRVGGDEILVGMSPSGMRPLHVMSRTEPAKFDTYMGTVES